VADSADTRRPASIYVLAGTNGAGKSSIAGAMFEQAGAEYFNPDRAALRILANVPGIAQDAANSLAWQQGKRLLERTIAGRHDFVFETTLGGETMTALLEAALSNGLGVRIWYVGLTSPALHVKRVRSRVAHGGHDIPEDTIRERYDRSRLNLIRLLPKLTELRMFDNSENADPHRGHIPVPRLILHVVKGKIVTMCDLASTPAWAKPIMAAAIKISAGPHL
jgi:predicted ABC-type ATPase